MQLCCCKQCKPCFRSGGSSPAGVQPAERGVCTPPQWPERYRPPPAHAGCHPAHGPAGPAGAGAECGLLQHDMFISGRGQSACTEPCTARGVPEARSALLRADTAGFSKVLHLQSCRVNAGCQQAYSGWSMRSTVLRSARKLSRSQRVSACQLQNAQVWLALAAAAQLSWMTACSCCSP